MFPVKKKVLISRRKTKSGNSSVGRAQPCQGWGREFESRFPLSEYINGVSAVNAEVAQSVEHNLAKVGVASSSLVFRSLQRKPWTKVFFLHEKN